MGISTTLKYLRKNLGLTQRELAERTGLSLSSIVSYENGLREPNSKAMAKLEGFFQVSGKYLLGEMELSSYHENIDDLLEAMKEFSPAYREFVNHYFFIPHENRAISLRAWHILIEHLMRMTSKDENYTMYSDFPVELDEILSIISMLNNDGRKEYILRGKELTEISKYTDK